MERSEKPLSDPMGPRPVSARWVIMGTLTLESATHLRGEPRGAVDMPVLKHPIEGRPLLPGTTLAGSLRSALADRLAGYRTKLSPSDAARLTRLFGAERGDPAGAQSPLIVFDSLGELPQELGIEIRDGVAIDPETGVAEAHKKFDFEVLPAGTRFPVRVDLILPSPGGGEEQELLELLAAALDAFSDGHVNLGARRSRGLGKVRARWRARRFDLTTRDGWMNWLLSDHEDPIGAVVENGQAFAAIQQACPERLKLERLLDLRGRILIELHVSPVHDILVRSPGRTIDGPDVSHLRSGGRPVLPGTSVAGAMRAHALRIANLVRADKGDAALWVDRLFGPRPKDGDRDRRKALAASRLRVAEVAIEDSRACVQTRIALDRFTQEVVRGALFQEETEVGGHATVTFELINPEPGELGLVLLLIKDLLHGRLGVGGSSSVGRGWMKGRARVIFEDGSTAELQPGQPPQGERAADVDRAIREFHEAAALRNEEEGRMVP